MVYGRNAFGSKFFALILAVVVSVILEVQIQRLQTQVRLLSKAQRKNYEADGMTNDLELMDERNPLLILIHAMKIDSLLNCHGHYIAYHGRSLAKHYSESADHWARPKVNSDFENDIAENWDTPDERLDAMDEVTNGFQFRHNEELIHSSDEKTIVFYNRVPKTGSTSFMGIVYSLCTKNDFHVIHLNVSKNAHVMGLADQMRFAQNVTTWTSKMPSFYHGHQSYLDFGRLGFQKKPLYINIVRKPLDRLVSYYYFLRFGDDFRPGLKRARRGNLETFDQCVVKGHRDCQLQRLWLQIPFFCGQHPACWEPGNDWALQKAKDNLINNYLVVGVTERLTEFVAVMEAVLPRYFKDATERFLQGSRSHLRKTHAKKELKPETMEYFKSTKVWQMENEFYLFVNRTFTDMLGRTFVKSRGKFVAEKKKFFFEKIRPKPKE